MLRRLIAALSANWLTIRVVGAFVLLIVVFFTTLTYTPLVKRFDVAAGIAHLVVSSTPLVGASGAVSGAMAMVAVLYGTRRVPVEPARPLAAGVQWHPDARQLRR